MSNKETIMKKYTDIAISMDFMSSPIWEVRSNCLSKNISLLEFKNIISDDLYKELLAYTSDWENYAAGLFSVSGEADSVDIMADIHFKPTVLKLAEKFHNELCDISVWVSMSTGDNKHYKLVKIK